MFVSSEKKNFLHETRGGEEGNQILPLTNGALSKSRETVRCENDAIFLVFIFLYRCYSVFSFFFFFLRLWDNYDELACTHDFVLLFIVLSNSNCRTRKARVVANCMKLYCNLRVHKVHAKLRIIIQSGKNVFFPLTHLFFLFFGIWT